MMRIKKGLAAITAVVIFAGSVGCSAVNSAARKVSDAYIDALLAMNRTLDNEIKAYKNNKSIKKCQQHNPLLDF